MSSSAMSSSALPAEKKPAEPHPNKLAPFNPTNVATIDEALALAKVVPEDVVWDLGCGDGRFVVRAAKERGARGVGVEYDAGLVERAHAHVEAEGMAGKVEIRHADVCTVDFQAASMIFIYLVPEGIGKIYESLDAVRRRPGTRIVSYIFSVKAWEPIEVRVCKGVKLYLYTSDSKLREEEVPPTGEERKAA